MKSKSDHSSNNKVELSWKNIVVVEEEWFSDMDLTDGATFPMSLIKRTKYRFNRKFNFHMTQSDAYGKFQ